MKPWENPAVRAALREIAIAILVALLTILGYHAEIVRPQVQELGAAVVESRALCQCP